MYYCTDLWSNGQCLTICIAATCSSIMSISSDNCFRRVDSNLSRSSSISTSFSFCSHSFSSKTFVLVFVFVSTAGTLVCVWAALSCCACNDKFFRTLVD